MRKLTRSDAHGLVYYGVRLVIAGIFIPPIVDYSIYWWKSLWWVINPWIG